MSGMNLEKIDTTFWNLKEPEWVRERNAQWMYLEKKLSSGRRKSELNTIKQYFLKGKMPNWEKYRKWDGDERHVDLLNFLWLHPSDDVALLTELFLEYVHSDLIHYKDVAYAYGSFFMYELSGFRWENNTVSRYQYPFLGRKNIILFNILMSGIDYAESEIELLNAGRINDYLAQLKARYREYVAFLYFRLWLLMPDNSPLSESALYQYDEVLDWVFLNIEDQSDEFIKSLEYKSNAESFYRALYCIFHYDSKFPECVGKVRAVNKLRQILSEKKFMAEFECMWEDVINDRVAVKNPWKWQCH